MSFLVDRFYSVFSQPQGDLPLLPMTEDKLSSLLHLERKEKETSIRTRIQAAKDNALSYFVLPPWASNARKLRVCTTYTVTFVLVASALISTTIKLWIHEHLIFDQKWTEGVSYPNHNCTYLEGVEHDHYTRVILNNCFSSKFYCREQHEWWHCDLKNLSTCCNLTSEPKLKHVIQMCTCDQFVKGLTLGDKTLNGSMAGAAVLVSVGLTFLLIALAREIVSKIYQHKLQNCEEPKNQPSFPIDEETPLL
jgi:hypothetical protein